jgi:Skp family chaperone for outer membrane proteins
MHKVTLVSLFIFLAVTFTLAQDSTELKIIDAPQISLDQVNQVPDREQEAINTKTSQVQEQISTAIQDTLHPDTRNSVFILRIDNENLTAVNKYEAKVLKSMSTMHKVLAIQKARGLITQEQYETACSKMIQAFRSAMLQRPLFKTQG